MKIKIIDNFLNSQDLKDLNNLTLPNVEDTGIKMHHNFISNNEIISASCFSTNFLKKLHNNYHQKALNILEELNPKKKSFTTIQIFTLLKQEKNLNFQYMTMFQKNY